jgi:hypothetical protein
VYRDVLNDDSSARGWKVELQGSNSDKISESTPKEVLVGRAELDGTYIVETDNNVLQADLGKCNVISTIQHVSELPGSTISAKPEIRRKLVGESTNQNPESPNPKLGVIE